MKRILRAFARATLNAMAGVCLMALAALVGCGVKVERGEASEQMAQISSDFGDVYATYTIKTAKDAGFMNQKSFWFEDENDFRVTILSRRFVNELFQHEAILKFSKRGTLCSGIHVFPNEGLSKSSVVALLRDFQRKRGFASIKKSLPRSASDDARNALTLTWTGNGSQTHLHLRPAQTIDMMDVLLGLEVKGSQQCIDSGEHPPQQNTNVPLNRGDPLPTELRWLSEFAGQ